MLHQVHTLKILPKYFEAVQNESKTFEIRKYDRNFKVDDILLLKEWENCEFTGKSTMRKVTYILKDSSYLQEGYVALGIRR